MRWIEENGWHLTLALCAATLIVAAVVGFWR